MSLHIQLFPFQPLALCPCYSPRMRDIFAFFCVCPSGTEGIGKVVLGLISYFVSGVLLVFWASTQHVGPGFIYSQIPHISQRIGGLLFFIGIQPGVGYEN